jgi:predicted SPOUT superfamily RNA methylase MTH1
MKPFGTKTIKRHKTITIWTKLKSQQTRIGFMSAQPLEQLKHQVDLAGDDGSIVDEAWGRYLDLAPVTVTTPETGLAGELTWVNEEKQDYYGYQVHQLPTARS